MPEEKLIAGMAKHHKERGKTGAKLDASGLQRSSEGSHIQYSGGRRMVIDGPFVETKEVMGGHMLAQAKEWEETTESNVSSVEQGGGLCRQS